MLEQFLNHIQQNRLLLPSERAILAVSGGVDSMVMLELFVRAKLSFGVAHCNFNLRPEEAAEEADLVRVYCNERGIDFHYRLFDTAAFAEKEKCSTQVAARELRYSFFNELLEGNIYHKIATAHHLNDSFETTIINLVRGTGLDGLTGVPVSADHIIRPLLFAKREDILKFAREQKIAWREDSSNATDDYSRNVIRNRVVPYLKEINPSLEETYAVSLARLRGARKIQEEYISNFKQRGVTANSKQQQINRAELERTASPALVLWELTKHLGFSFDQICKVIEVRQVGKMFYASDTVLLIDRDYIILQKKDVGVASGVTIDEKTNEALFRDKKLVFTQDEDVHIIPTDKRIASIDADKLIFPLLWRRWDSGDVFYPLGAPGRKKISDFLIDRKIDRMAKSEVTVLESDGEIIWVVGERISDKVKITKDTKRVLRISFGE